MVKEHSNAVLVGEGADELFGGYRMVLKNPKVKSEEQRERLAQKLFGYRLQYGAPSPGPGMDGQCRCL